MWFIVCIFVAANAFPIDSTIRTPNGIKRFDELKVGDFIESDYGTYEPILGFSDYYTDRIKRYGRINGVYVDPKRYIFTKNGALPVFNVSSGVQLSNSVFVESIFNEVKRGFIMPVTWSFSCIVEDIKVSQAIHTMDNYKIDVIVQEFCGSLLYNFCHLTGINISKTVYFRRFRRQGARINNFLTNIFYYESSSTTYIQFWAVTGSLLSILFAFPFMSLFMIIIYKIQKWYCRSLLNTYQKYKC